MNGAEARRSEDGRSTLRRRQCGACLFLRLPAEEVCKLTLEDLTPPRRRPRLEPMWSSLLRGDRTGDLEYGRTLPWDLQMPDGTSVQVEISGTQRFRPGRHLLVIVFPAARALNERIGSARPPATEILTRREREILTLVALGHTEVQLRLVCICPRPQWPPMSRTR